MDGERKARGADEWERKQRKLEKEERERESKRESEREKARESKLLLSSDINSIDSSNVVSLVTGGCF